MASKIARIAALATLSSLTAGCIFFSSPRDRAMRRSPSFKDGYADGCAAATTKSANYRETPYRDEVLYKSDSLYRAGWANGYQTCNPDRTGAAPSTTPVPAPGPPH